LSSPLLRMKPLLLALLLVVSTGITISNADAVKPAAFTPGVLYVTYVNTQPSTLHSGDLLTVIFDVVYFTTEPYLGPISHPATGLKTATILLSSNQTKEYPDMPISPANATAGEYLARIQLPQDLLFGSHTVYVMANSLHLTAQGTPMTGPITNVGYKETETTSDYSDLQVLGSPSIFSRLLASTQDMLLLALAIIILILVALSMVARRLRIGTDSREMHWGLKLMRSAGC